MHIDSSDQKWTNAADQRISSEADIRSSGEEIGRPLQLQKFHYWVHKCFTLVPSSWVAWIYITHLHALTVIPLPTSRFPECSLQMFMHFSFMQYAANLIVLASISIRETWIKKNANICRTTAVKIKYLSISRIWAPESGPKMQICLEYLSVKWKKNYYW